MLNNALGLDTLQKQKQHHYIHIRGREPAPVPEDLQKKFDYGTKNEVNSVATLISTVVPAYLPACFAYYDFNSSACISPFVLRLLRSGAIVCRD